MRMKSLVLASTIALAWAGSLWMAFWSGFSAHMAVAVAVDRGTHEAQLVENIRLLSMLERGDPKSARASLADSVALEGKLIDLERQIPKFSLIDFVSAGLTSSREGIELLRVAQKSERPAQRLSTKKKP